MEDLSKFDLLEEKSEQVKEVLGQAPNVLIRWGSLIFLFSILSILLISYLIKYPDIINSRIIITTLNPPARILSKSEGSLIMLFVKDNEQVEEGKVLAVISSTARYENIIEIKSKLDSIVNSTYSFERIYEARFTNKVILGEVQNDYYDFIKKYQDYYFFITFNPLSQDINSLKKQHNEYDKLVVNQAKREKIYEKELRLAQIDYDRSLKLYKEKAISASDLEAKEREWLKMEGVLEELHSNLINTNISISTLNKTIQQLKMQEEEKMEQLRINLMDSYKKLNNSIINWENKYLIKSPITGNVAFFKFWSKNQVIKLGEEVLTIVPQNNTNMIGKVLMPIVNSGKVKVGQKVNIQLDNYPYEEFGVVRGQITSISTIPRDNSYSIEVKLVNGLKTSYNKSLEFKQELQGTSEIVTNDIRLIERLFYQFRLLGND